MSKTTTGFPLGNPLKVSNRFLIRPFATNWISSRKSMCHDFPIGNPLRISKGFPLDFLAGKLSWQWRKKSKSKANMKQLWGNEWSWRKSHPLSEKIKTYNFMALQMSSQLDKLLGDNSNTSEGTLLITSYKTQCKLITSGRNPWLDLFQIIHPHTHVRDRVQISMSKKRKSLT